MIAVLPKFEVLHPIESEASLPFRANVHHKVPAQDVSWVQSRLEAAEDVPRVLGCQVVMLGLFRPLVVVKYCLVQLASDLESSSFCHWNWLSASVEKLLAGVPDC